ncbi:MAG: alpha-N-arabinofuranosidase [Methylobacteriaceae bacterium]|nr:alpha-N-arabinofuranosidase [Methylobacteriaceae bacterium]
MKARATIHRDFKVGAIDERIYSGFLEHLGRAVYGGIYEPSHPSAGAGGFRKDVLDLVGKLRLPLIRYPGGNFVSAYNWEDGIGPREKRPVRLDLAWRTRETNEIGIDEFASWCDAAGTQMMLAVNLGTRGHDAALSLLEYCNHPDGTYWSDLRRRNGSEKPYGVKVWCLGNEMDGVWQIGHKTAHEYGRLANEIGRAMKAFDSKLELVACGSTHSQMKTYPAWEVEVLEECYETVDYISLHSYFENYEGDYLNHIAKPIVMDRYIHTVGGAIDFVKAKLRLKKDLYISFDEWNVWYHQRRQDHTNFKSWDWPVAPPLCEETYNFEDALVVGCVMNTFIRRCDRVKIACIAQLVNVIAPIMTETGGRAWRQTIYYPFLLGSLYGRGEAMQVALDAPTYDAAAANDVPYLDIAAVHDPGARTIAIFAINRHPREPLDLAIDLAGFPKTQLIEHILLHHVDLNAVNTAEAPETVKPSSQDATLVEDGELRSQLRPASYNVIRISL